MTMISHSILALALACPLLGAAAQDPADDPRTTRELLDLVMKQRDAVDPLVFEALGLRRDEEALKALRRATSTFFTPDSVARCFAAFRHFKGGPHEAEVIEFIAERAVQPADRFVMRALARALLPFGSAAGAAFERVLAESVDLDSRRIAVGALVPALRMRGDVTALQALLDYYRPPISGPRDLGVRTLAAFQSDEARALLHTALERDRYGPAVKALVVDALAEMQHSDVEGWLRAALRKGDPVVRLAAARALGRRGCTAHLHDLERLEKSGDPRLQHAALIEQARLHGDGDPHWRAKVLAAAESRDWARRLAACELIGAWPEAQERLAELLEDESPIVRLAAVDAHVARRRAASVPLLIARMAQDAQRVRERAREALELLTGVDHGPTAARWHLWWDAEGARFSPPPLDESLAAQAERAARRRATPTQADFYGIPLGSDRVCFVLDQSGSMDDSTRSGETRLEAVQRELEGTLGAYPDGALFNVLYFAYRTDAWKSGLTEMTAKTRVDATRWSGKHRAKGGTAIYDALLDALEDQDVDTIVVLSDGQPMGGEIDDPLEILYDIQARNELRAVRIHAVSFQCPGTLLQDLAAATGGEYREVD
jgi:HEAT repeat protein